MGKTSLVSNIYHVDVGQCAESNAPVYIMEIAVSSIVGKHKIDEMRKALEKLSCYILCEINLAE